MRSAPLLPHRLCALASCALALSSLGACGASDHTSRDSPELVVFAAASLREGFDALGKELERVHPGVTVRISYAGSQVLRAQLEQGAAADVIAAAAPEELAPLLAQQRIAAPQIFAHNELVIARPSGATAPTSLRALPEVARIVIGSAESPIGRYTRSMLARADAALGAAFGARVMKAVVSEEPNTRQVLAKVSLREADAGIVYRTDALAAATTVDIVPIPRELNERAQYVLASVRGSARPELARVFIALVTGPEGQAVLRRFGFLPARASSGEQGAATSERSGATR